MSRGANDDNDDIIEVVKAYQAESGLTRSEAYARLIKDLPRLVIPRPHPTRPHRDMEELRIRRVLDDAVKRHELRPFLSFRSADGEEPQTVALKKWLVELFLDGKRKSKRRLYYLIISNRERLVEEVYRGKPPQPDSLYNMICGYVNELIDAGKIQWNLILDTSRRYEGRVGFASFDTWLDAVEANADENIVLLNPWVDQPVNVEIWTEKATLSLALEPTCKEYRVRFFPTHGNFPHVWARTIANRVLNEDRKKLVVFYLGDYDPTGQNIPEYIATVLMPKVFGELGVPPKRWFQFHIIAATAEDRKRYFENLVPLNDKDPNARTFLEEYGGRGLEVDAIPEEQLQERVGAAIRALIDPANWRRSMKREAKAKKRIVQMVNRERAR